MRQLGIDLGTSTVKIVLLEDGNVEQHWIAKHHGLVLQTLLSGLQAIDLPMQFAICITGNEQNAVTSVCKELDKIEDIPAIVEGVKSQVHHAGCIIDIGSQSARFITCLDEKAPRFAVNEHCAGGTGSFFEDQMSRLGLQMEDYSRLVEQGREVPNLSGRCAVFAKTDIIHRQQEGVVKQDILLGLCYAMIRNYKTTIVKTLPIKKPVVFTGGVTCNTGVVRAIRDIFSLAENELIIPEQARYVAAIGAAKAAQSVMTKNQLYAALQQDVAKTPSSSALPKLVLTEGTILAEPSCTEKVLPEGCYLGIDIGSTSTNLVLITKENVLVDFQYLRTAGEPEGVVRNGLGAIQKKYGNIKYLGVGVTGSGRERMGRMMGADAIRDEITAQAKAATHWMPEADTVFEIGGQDSKYISLKDGEVIDFQMNKICAAGTGSFVEEQAARMGISIGDFGPLALSGEHPCDLGERCTVFIETSIAQATAQGANRADIAAGLCHSIVKNYLHKVVGSKKVGKSIVLQGGVDYNPGIVAAFQSAYGDAVQVSPVFSISGAFGAALLAKEAVGSGNSQFLGVDFPREECRKIATSEEIHSNRAFYKKAGALAVEGYDASINPKKKTIGVPLALIMFKFFPMVNEFFKNLGFNVILSNPSNEETIKLSQEFAQAETCFPIKLIYGHMMQLAAKKVDYIFLPCVHTIRHPLANAVHSYACPFMQMAGRAIFENLELEKKGIQLLSPVLDLELGVKMMGKAMLDTGAALGFSKPRCIPGMMKGALAVNKYSENVEKLGREMMASLKPEDKVLVLITRNYGLSDPVLNMGIPEILLSRGYKVMTLGHLPGMSLDLSGDYPGMYWPFGDHILSGAKLIAHHPNLYAVYLTNHGCGPDTLISHMFREEMGEKPYLQIEVDEHYSKVGVITRIEAFLNSLSHRPAARLPKNFDILDVKMKKANIKKRPDANKKLMIPDLGEYTAYFVDYFIRQGMDAVAMTPFTRETLTLGRAEMNSKEYLPLPMLLGGCLQTIGWFGLDESPQFLIPFGYGADADGQYARAVRAILDREGHTKNKIIVPTLEELPASAYDIELLFRTLLTGDVLYSLPWSERSKLSPPQILDMHELLLLAAKAASFAENKKTIAAVGTPMCLTSLNEGILDALEQENHKICRAPLSEMMWFLWKDNENGNAGVLGKLLNMMKSVADALGAASSFSSDINELFKIADQSLDHFSATFGRYRYAKAVHMGQTADAVLTLAPRYENTAIVLELRGQSNRCKAPLFELALDGDWDEGSWSKLHSFLYYC